MRIKVLISNREIIRDTIVIAIAARLISKTQNRVAAATRLEISKSRSRNRYHFQSRTKGQIKNLQIYFCSALLCNNTTFQAHTIMQDNRVTYIT